jgi:N-acetylglutamate synthase-like GNAT family acetyltransferase
MRRADAGDLAAVAELLAPLEAAGVLAPRSRAQLEADLPFFVVAEREAKARAWAPICARGRRWSGR